VVRRGFQWFSMVASKSIVAPGGSSPRPPFSRFARRAVTGRTRSLLRSYLTVWTGPKDLLVVHRLVCLALAFLRVPNEYSPLIGVQPQERGSEFTVNSHSEATQENSAFRAGFAVLPRIYKRNGSKPKMGVDNLLLCYLY
jgi:hypothetical protein